MTTLAWNPLKACILFKFTLKIVHGVQINIIFPVHCPHSIYRLLCIDHWSGWMLVPKLMPLPVLFGLLLLDDCFSWQKIFLLLMFVIYKQCSLNLGNENSNNSGPPTHMDKEVFPKISHRKVVGMAYLVFIKGEIISISMLWKITHAGIVLSMTVVCTWGTCWPNEELKRLIVPF